MENVKAREEGERFSCFQSLFSYVSGARWVLGSQVSIEHDGSNILKNKHMLAETHTLSFSLLCMD